MWLSEKVAVKLSANFETNLTAIEAFSVENDTRQAYARLSCSEVILVRFRK